MGQPGAHAVPKIAQSRNATAITNRRVTPRPSARPTRRLRPYEPEDQIDEHRLVFP
jgi:hypothetical protein